jgi:hypothetical protein
MTWVRRARLGVWHIALGSTDDGADTRCGRFLTTLTRYRGELEWRATYPSGALICRVCARR